MANGPSTTSAVTTAAESAGACVVRVRAIVSAEHARAGFGWCGVVESVVVGGVGGVVGGVVSGGDSVRDRAWVGSRVTSQPEVACGACERCKTGLSAHCEQASPVVIAGGGERATVPIAALVRTPAGLEDGSVACAWMVARAIHASRAASVHARAFVTVLGEDALGVALAQVLGARWASTRVLADGEFASRACERLAIKHRRTDDAGRRSDQDAVFLSGPTPAMLRLASELARPRGVVVLASEPMATRETWSESLALACDKELTLIHAVRPSPGTLGEALAFLERGVVQPQVTESAARASRDLPAWTMTRVG